MRTSPLLLAFFALCTPQLCAQTTVGGPIHVDTDWTNAGSPYVLSSTITVTGGATLRIHPGTEVRLSAGDSIFVGDANLGAGTLVARGSETQPILFTSLTGAPGSWESIRFTDDAVDTQLDSAGQYFSGSVLEKCVVEYGNEGSLYGAVSTEYCSLLVQNCTLRANRGAALQAYLSGSSALALRVRNTRFASNEQALSIIGGASHVVSSCSFRHHGVPNGKAVAAIANAPFSVVEACMFEENTGGTASLQLTGSSSNALVDRCFFALNVHSIAALSTSSSSVAIHRTDFQSNRASSTSLLSGGAVSLVSSSPSQISGCRFEGNSSLSGGAIGMFLTVCQIRDSALLGNNSQSSGGAIRATQSPLGVTDTTLDGNSASGLGGAISAVGQSLTITRCRIIGNTSGVSGGGLHSGTALTLHESEIACNSAPLGGGIDLAASPASLAGDPIAGRFNVIRGNVATQGSAVYCRVISAAGPVDANFLCWGESEPNVDPNMIWDALDDPIYAQMLVGQVATCVPSDCQCTPSTFCTSTPNSTGVAATIGYSGTASISANDLVLTVEGCPPNALGGFYFGPWRSATPLGAGTRCIDGGRVALGLVNIRSNGSVSFPVSVLSPPALGLLTFGSTWNFQFWYRDPNSVEPSFNLSDALAVTFCE